MKNRILCGIIIVLILILLVLVLIASKTSPDTGSTPTVVNTCDSLSEELSASGADNPHSIITPHSDTSNLSGAEIFSVSTSHSHESALLNVMLPAPPSGVIPSP